MSQSLQPIDLHTLFGLNLTLKIQYNIKEEAFLLSS